MNEQHELLEFSLKLLDRINGLYPKNSNNKLYKQFPFGADAGVVSDQAVFYCLVWVPFVVVVFRLMLGGY